MLPLAAPASSEQRAARRRARVPRADHVAELGARESRAPLHDSGAHAIARRDVGYEDDLPIVVCESVAAVRQALHHELERLVRVLHAGTVRTRRTTGQAAPGPEMCYRAGGHVGTASRNRRPAAAQPAP